MRNFLMTVSFLSMFFFHYIPTVYAQGPALLFSDLDSGPSKGLGDRLGSGVIVTVWGTNLGTSQGASVVQIGGVPAAHVYYWGNATPSISGAGPSDLYSYHHYQMIAFSVPAAAPSGLTNITVTVNSVASNGLPFTVREGRIFFVKKNGSNTSSGSWSSPWQTMYYAADHPGIQAGDTIYVADNLTDWVNVGTNARVNGTASNRIAFGSYPGYLATAAVKNCGSQAGLNNSWPVQYWTFFKIQAQGCLTAMHPFPYARFVGNALTNYPGTCSKTGASGAMDAPGPNWGGVQYYGNWIHDWGCQETMNLQHTIYIEIRDGSKIAAPEFGWNYLSNNMAWSGIHFYDESYCGTYTGTVLVHDNVIINQNAPGMDIGWACYSSGPEAPFYIYNNLFIADGKLNTWGQEHGYSYAWAVAISGNMTSDIYFFNNTIYGYGDVATKQGYAWTYALSGGKVYFQNNLIVDTNDFPFYRSLDSPPSTHSNNLWYSSSGRTAPPWDSSPITGNPNFVNPSGGFFDLQANSPAIGRGVILFNQSPLFSRDIMGTPRADPPSIGSFEYSLKPVP